MRNKELIKLRVEHDLTQTAMAEICEVSVGTYNLVENGKRRGSKPLWHKIQEHFELDGEQMWRLQNPEL